MTAVRVNEAIVSTYATRDAATWWETFRQAMPPSRFGTVAVGGMGDMVDVACADREHAEWLVGAMTEHGIPKSALKVIR